MTQAFYAHMNNKTIKIKIKKEIGSCFRDKEKDYFCLSMFISYVAFSG
jgi:hypothetical protein